MKKIYSSTLLVVLFQAIAFMAFSQGTSISGIIKDSSAQKPLSYVTVELYKNAQPVKSVYTNESGKFNIAGVDTGNYKLIISHTGFEDHEKELVVSGGKPVELNEINLRTATSTMQGVVVRARKPLIEQTDDKIVFNVENDPATKTETAIDILRKTPFVTVDGDNNITVNGQSNFKVLLNGRETAMFAQNVKDALKGFPGALITRIEVITTPSAKYDAEDVGGVINIITKKKVAGYNGSINTYLSNQGWKNLNMNFSAKWGKLGFTMYYGANGASGIMGRSRMETVPFVSSYFTRRLLQGSREMSHLWNFGNGELNWEVDSLNTMSFYGNLSGGKGTVVFDQTITTSFANGEDSTSYYDLRSRNEFPTRSVGADYIRKFSSNKEKEFSIRFNGEFGNSNSFLNSIMDNPVEADRHVINNSVARNRQYTIQSDYIYPMTNSTKLEAGVKGIMRRASSDFESMIRNNAGDNYKLNDENTDYFRYDQDVYSAYGTYSFKIKKTSFRLGARMEHTLVNGDFMTSKSKVEQSYTNLLPNLQATTKFSNAFTMVVSYSDRIQRPFIWNLNPFRNNNDPRFISYGNPNLEPQVIHSVSVQTRYSKNGTFAGITFNGSYSDNMIVQYSSFDAVNGVTSTTSANLGKETVIGAQGNINTKINPDWNVSLNGSIRYNMVENKLDPSQKNSGFGGNANLNTSYLITKRFTTSGFAGFFRNGVSIQTSYPLNIWYGINAGYKFFKEKLTASVGIVNFFQKERDWQLVTIDPVFKYTSTTTMPFRGLSVSLSWNFGKLTENVSKKKGVSNDDLLQNNSGN